MAPPARPTTPDLYKVLGIARSASAVEIKKAYRVLALKYHPDKSSDPGDAAKFKDMNSAYELLSDPDRKRNYDQFGITDDNQHQQQQHANSMPDIFSQMFNMNKPFHQHQQQQRGSDTVHELHMSLEELFKGRTYNLNVSREQICGKCSGKGGLIMQTCPGCQGSGQQTTMRALGPGFMQRVDMPCCVCKTSGEIAQDRCTDCSGHKTTAVTQSVKLEIPAGAGDGDRFVQPGLGNAAPGITAGDVIFVVKQKPHKVLTRSGHDLLMNISLTLRQSLCGFSVQIQHIDDSVVTLSNAQGKVTKPGSKRVIESRGMKPSGNLIVTYKVLFPDSVEQCADIAEALPALISVRS